jgi:hypothetical protein
MRLHRAKSLQSASNIFVINLAVADFFMMTKTFIFIYNCFLGQGYGLGFFWCQMYALVGAYTGLVQASTNACIAYDRYRYINIVPPLTPNNLKIDYNQSLVSNFLYAKVFVQMYHRSDRRQSWQGGGDHSGGADLDLGNTLGTAAPFPNLGQIRSR